MREMSVKVLVCDPLDAEGVERLRQEDFVVDVKSSIEPAELERVVAGYDALVVRSRTKVTKQVLEKGRRLKVVGRVGAGVDNIDSEAAEKLGIAVLNTPEAPSDSVAELTVGLMLAIARRIPLADRSMKDGKWSKKELEGTLLNGKTLGLIGLGHIGAKVAQVAKAFGMKILVFKRTPPSRETLDLLGAEFVSLGELLRRSDVVSIHVPLTDQTVGMIGEKELNAMKEGTVLVNTSRGGIVDEDRPLLHGVQLLLSNHTHRLVSEGNVD